MILTLLRHGIAIDAAAPGAPADDAARPLTAKGRRRLTAAALGLAALGVAPQEILTSPRRRARETAELAAPILGFPPQRIVLSAALDFDATPDQLWAALEALGQHERTLCVGHSPNLERIAADALRSPHGAAIALKKAGAAAISLSKPGEPGTLLWLLTPKLLRILGRSLTQEALD